LISYPGRFVLGKRISEGLVGRSILQDGGMFCSSMCTYRNGKAYGGCKPEAGQCITWLGGPRLKAIDNNLATKTRIIRGQSGSDWSG